MLSPSETRIFPLLTFSKVDISFVSPIQSGAGGRRCYTDLSSVPEETSDDDKNNKESVPANEQRALASVAGWSPGQGAEAASTLVPFPRHTLIRDL